MLVPQTRPACRVQPAFTLRLALVLCLTSATTFAQTKTYQAPSSTPTTYSLSSSNKDGNPTVTAFSYTVSSGSSSWTTETTATYRAVDLSEDNSIPHDNYTDSNGITRLGYKFTLKPGSTPTWGGQPRVEFDSASGADQNPPDGAPNPNGWAAGVLTPGTEVWFIWSMYLDTNFNDNQDWCTLFQLHPGNTNWDENASGNKYPNPGWPGLAVHNDTIGFGMGPDANSPNQIWTGSVSAWRGKWVDLAVHAKLSTGSDGLLEFYVNGSLAGTPKSGPNMVYVTKNNPTRWYYLKQGYYRDGKPNTQVSTTDTVYMTPILVSFPTGSSSPDFALSASPSSVSSSTSSSTSSTISVTPSGGYTGTVTLSASGCPADATCTFNPSSVTGGSGSSTLTMTSGNTQGSYTVTVTGTDGTLSHQTGVSWTIATPAHGPNISNVQASNMSSTSARISWSTDVASTSQVNYGTTAAYGSSTTEDTSDVTKHSQMITGLTPNTTYHFQVVSSDSNGSSSSGDYQFTTTQPTYSDQQGSPGDESGSGVANDGSGNQYVVGPSRGGLGYGGGLFGPWNGGEDAFVAKYDPNGAYLWGFQFGDSGDQHPYGVAMDTDGSGFYVVGSTTTAFQAGLTYSGGAHDAFVSKYDTDGNQLWIVLIGSSGDDIAYGVAADTNGGVSVVGSTTGSLYATNAGGIDAWVAHFDSSTGAFVWGRQLGNGGDEVALAVAMDNNGGDLYVVGSTTDALNEPYQGGAHDAFIADYIYSNGTRDWVHNFGTSGDDIANAAAADQNMNLDVGGSTTGALGGTHVGGTDAWLAQYDYNGVRQWSTQFGGTGNDAVYGLASDPSNNIFLTGATASALSIVNYGGNDVFTARYAPSGVQTWLRQTGSGADDTGIGVSVSTGATTVFSDGFNRTTGLGSSWTVASGTWSTTGSAAKATGGTHAYSSWTGSPHLDSTAQVALVAPVPSTSVGAFVRGTTSAPDADHYAGYVGTDGKVHIARRNNYTYTYLANSTTAFPTSGTHTVSIEATGDGPVYLTLQVDGSTWLTYTDTSASALTTAGKDGMFDYNGAGALFDSFSVIQMEATGVSVAGETLGSVGSLFQGGSSDAFLVQYAP